MIDAHQVFLECHLKLLLLLSYQVLLKEGDLPLLQLRDDGSCSQAKAEAEWLSRRI